MDAANTTPLWGYLVYVALALILVAGMLSVSYLLGQRHRDPATAEPFEGGFPPTGSARLRFSVKYYLPAMMFVLFDLETVFIVAWALVVREAGWPGFWLMAFFIAVLGIALAYLWRLGALSWGTSARLADPGRNGPRGE